MKRRVFTGLILAAPLSAGLPAMAAQVRLDAGEIETLLAGNTIVGTWSGSSYRQYYDADGTTIIVPDEGRANTGRWRTDPETDEYESWWRSTGWIDYAMVRTDEGGYAWVNGDRLEPFEVLEGRQIE